MKIVHSIHFPVSARSFVAPIVTALNREGFEASLWFEALPDHSAVMKEILVPQKHLCFDLSLNPMSFSNRVLRFSLELRRSEVGVLHAHQMRASIIPLIAGARMRVPVRIYHNHGLPYLGYGGLKKWLLRFLEELNIRLATHVIFVSHSNFECAVASGLISKKKGRVLGAGSAVGIELNDFPRERFDEAAKCEARVALGLLPQSFVLGYVGRPVARKGFHRLLSAWEIVGLGRFGGTLLIAGCSEDDCRKAVGSVPAGVKALGYLTNLTSFYSACDAVTLPSDHEGFPYSLLEAAAAGRALHGTDIPGIRCAIVPGVTGLLYESGNMRDLANSLLRLSSDESLRNVLGKNARSRVERFFSRETIIQEYVSFYRDLCIFG